MKKKKKWFLVVRCAGSWRWQLCPEALHSCPSSRSCCSNRAAPICCSKPQLLPHSLLCLLVYPWQLCSYLICTDVKPGLTSRLVFYLACFGKLARSGWRFPHTPILPATFLAVYFLSLLSVWFAFSIILQFHIPSVILLLLLLFICMFCFIFPYWKLLRGNKQFGSVPWAKLIY